MLIRITLLIFVCAFSLMSFSQNSKLLDWKKLEVNKLQEKVDTVNEMTFDVPVFTEKQKELSGKKLLVEGYLNVLEGKKGETGNLYLLQRYNQSDFGADYPLDAIIEIKFKKEPTDINATVKRNVLGVLVLNDDDFMHPFYILEKAKIKK
jgi:hypothetical protein